MCCLFGEIKMKKISCLASVVAISSLSVSLAFASASHLVKVTVDCPDIGHKGSEIVTNYGTYVAGPGIERVNGDTPTSPLFQGPLVPGSNIPMDLVAGGYFNAGVDYNPLNGAVVCHYSSSLGFDSFAMSYMLKNAIGGVVASSGSEEIHIKLPLGLVK